MEKEKDIITTIQESKKFQDYNEGLQIVWDAIDKYGSLSKEAMEAVKKKKELFSKLFKNVEEEEKYFSIRKLLKDDYIPLEVKKELFSWDIINESPYSDSFYNSKNINWDSKPEGSLRISDHWNFESHGQIHCKLKGINEYTEGWKMARYENGEYIILKEFK